MNFDIKGNNNEAHAIQLLSYLPRRPDYLEWILAISAVGNEFGEDTALRILRSRFIDEEPQETLGKIRNRIKSISFGTLVNLAKQYGYKPSENRGYVSPVPEKSFEPGPAYSFDNELAEERSAVYQFEAGMSRWEADRRVILEYPEANYERAYRVAVNEGVVDKNFDPATNKAHEGFKIFTNGFKNKYMTIRELAESIGKGFPFVACRLKEDAEGLCIRSNSNFECSDLFAIDIDSGLRLDEAFSIPEIKRALMVYTTCSHTEERHRFRIIFPLHCGVTQADEMRAVTSYYIKIFGSDANCSDPARGFYGNRNAKIWLLPFDEVIQFKDGTRVNL